MCSCALAIGKGTSSNIILNCNLVRFGVYMVIKHPDKNLNSLGIILIP